MPPMINKMIERYIKIPIEEFVVKPVGGTRTKWVYMEEQEIKEEEK